MARSEVAGDTWTLPSDRSKNWRAHSTFLTPLACALLEAVPDIGSPQVTGTTAISGWSRAKRRLDSIAGVSGWRLHDIRRTVATMLAEGGIAPPHVISALLNHQTGGVTAIYNRAQYAAEKKAALERWSDHVESIVNIHGTAGGQRHDDPDNPGRKG